MTGGMHYTPSHTNICNFFDFQLTFSQLILHLKCRNLAGLLKFKVRFLVLVYVFNINLFEFLVVILEKGLFCNTSLPGVDPMESVNTQIRKIIIKRQVTWLKCYNFINILFPIDRYWIDSTALALWWFEIPWSCNTSKPLPSDRSPSWRSSIPALSISHSLLITYSALNLLTKRYNTYSIDKYRTIQYFSRLLTLFTMRCLHYIDRGYYTVARRYEFYVRVARTISHEWAQRTSEILFLPREHKIHIFKPTCNVLFII